MKKVLRWLIHKFDRNIHSKRVDTVLFYVQTFLFALLLIVLSIAFGVVGFMVIEGYDFWDAIFMTIITISTVGYGEVKPLSNLGRLFASILIVTNIGVFAYSVSTLANILVEGEYRRIFSDLLIGRKIDKMKNHIIVCGYGRYGKNVIERIITQGIDCVLIEKDLEKINKLREQHSSVLIIDGDATDEETLIEAGVSHARALITTLPEDADNVYTILSARALNDQLKIISRANNPNSKKNLVKAGANHVILPENIGGFYMAALVTKPDIVQAFSEMSSLDGSSFRIAEAILDPMPKHLFNKQLTDLKLEEIAGVKIIGIKLPNQQFVVNPIATTQLQHNMAILVIGNQTQITKFHQLTKEYEFIE